MKIFEAFAGVGSQAMALKECNIDVEFVGISEIDKNAIQAYNFVHGDTYNFGDISKINYDNIPQIDILTYSFPCQDISSVGTIKGFKKGSNTNSSLLWECEKLIFHTRPKILLLENVPNVNRGKNRADFKVWENILEKMGYTNSHFNICATEVGIPQRRNRFFMVSTNNGQEYFKNDILKHATRNLTIDDIIEKAIPFQVDYRFINSINLESLIDDKMYFLDDRDWKMNGVMVRDVCSTQRAGRTGLKVCYKYNNKLYYRNITPLESWRLMGFSDDDYFKIEKELTKGAIYKICGNSIVKDVLYCIFKEVISES